MAYRQERNYENINKWQFEQLGEYGIPPLAPELPEYCKDTNGFISFNYAKSFKGEPATKGVHFFIDDYQFNRLWTNPEAYLELLSQFKAVMTPDFSTYSDWPKALQIYNHYRKHWLGAYWQANGLSVIPTISWSDKDSFKWCFDGEPVGGVVAVSSVGTQVHAESKELFATGYREMLKRLKPELIYFYGKVPEEFQDDRIIPLQAFQEKVRERFAKTQNK